MGKNDRSSEFAKRLKVLRKASGMKQSEFCEALAAYIGKGTRIPISTLSSWELGEKRPTYEIMIEIANYFNVSLDFLLGRTKMSEMEYFADDTQKSQNIEDYLVRISSKDISEYDGKPVFIVCGTAMKSGKWSIYNASKELFCTRDERVHNTDRLTFYVLATEGME